MSTVTISTFCFPKAITFKLPHGLESMHSVHAMNTEITLAKLQTDFPNTYIKLKSHTESVDELETEVKCLNLLKDKCLSSHSIVPRIITSGVAGTLKVTYDGEESRDYTDFITYIVMEHCGTSLEELYFTPEMRDEMYGHSLKPQGHEGKIPDFLGGNITPRMQELYNGQFDTIFPHPIPEEDKDKVREIIQELSKYIDHGDLHAGNFVKDSKGVIRVIDFECSKIL